MSFVHPGIATVTLALAAAPVIIHLIHRRRYRVESWAAMALLRRAEAHSRSRMRLEQWLLLALRTLAILAVGMAAARPRISDGTAARVLGAAVQDRILVIDDSASMSALREDGKSAFDAAVEAALGMLDGFPAGDRVAVVTSSTPVKVWTERPMTDRHAVREILKRLKCTWRTGDTRDAIREAGTLTIEPEGGAIARRFYVLTDVARHEPGEQEPTATAPVDGAAGGKRFDSIMYVDVGSQQRANVGVRGFRCRSALLAAGLPGAFVVEIVNHGTTEVAGARVEITQEGRPLRTVDVPRVRPGEAVECPLEIEFRRAGPQRLMARLKDWRDVLAADDQRFLSVEVVESVPVLGVTRVAAGYGESDPLFYYSAALSTGSRRTGRAYFSYRGIEAAELATQALAEARVVVLADVERLPKTAWSRLAAFVRDGGGLIVFLGPHVSAEGYNAALAQMDGGLLLPVALGAIVDRDATGKPNMIRVTDVSNALLADLAGQSPGSLQSASVRGLWEVEVHRQAGARTLVLTDQGQPLLVAGEYGRGRVLVWTAGADMTWTNLPGKPDYVPFALNLTAYAADVGRHDEELIIGAPIVAALAPGVARQGWEMLRPGGVESPLEADAGDAGLAIAYRDTDEPGLYELRSGNDRRVFAVNVDPREGNLQRATPEQIARVAGAGVEVLTPDTVTSAAETIGVPREFVTLCMTVLFALVLVETLAAAWLGGGR